MNSRVVLDTNVVLSALLFAQGRLVGLRTAWQKGEIAPLVCEQSVRELLRVLSYPKFRLNPDEQEVLLADYLPFCETVFLPKRLSKVPPCRDPDDELFLHLALAGKAMCLITGDLDLLSLAKKFRIPIWTAEQWYNRHQNQA